MWYFISMHLEKKVLTKDAQMNQMGKNHVYTYDATKKKLLGTQIECFQVIKQPSN